MKLSVIIPVFNERDTLSAVVERVARVALPGWEREIIIVNDGSTDGTREAADALAGERGGAEIVVAHADCNRGKGAAVRLGYRRATGDVCLVQDADLELFPEDYPALLEPFSDPAVEAVYGRRDFRAAEMPALWRLGNQMISLTATLLYGARVSDVETCYKAVRRGTLETLAVGAHGFEFEVEMTAKLLRRGIRPREVPVRYAPRTRKQGKKIRMSDGIKALWYLLRYRVAVQARAPQPGAARVLVVSSKYPPEYAGSGLRMHRLYARLKAQYGIETAVLASSAFEWSWRTRRYVLDGVRVAKISSPFKRWVGWREGRPPRWIRRWWYALSGLDECARTALWLVRFGRRWRAVHVLGSSWVCGTAVIWAGLTGRTIVREVVTMDSRPDDPAGMRWLVGPVLKRTRSLIVAISPRLAERAAALGFRRIWCRPNPVDERRFYVDWTLREAARASDGRFGAEDIVLVEMSKYIRGKNKALAIRAMRHLPDRFRLLVSGPVDDPDRPLIDDLKGLAEELGLGSRVLFEEGFVERPEAYYRLADVFVFPSVHDGLGTPLLEALCCGVPVVASRLPGITDRWIHSGVNGYTADPAPDAFARCIRAAVELPRQGREAAAKALLAEAGCRTIDAEYVMHVGGVTADGRRDGR
ncbi:MAG TPA: glycosyltransferase [bacterium]